jgi:hypothetical protein
MPAPKLLFRTGVEVVEERPFNARASRSRGRVARVERSRVEEVGVDSGRRERLDDRLVGG